MLAEDLLALRPGGADDAASAAPSLGPAPAPMAVPSREARGERVRRLGASTAVTLFCHAILAVLFVAAWHSMIRDVNAPEPISVDVVDQIPGEKLAPPPKKDPPPPEPPKPEPPKPDAKAEPAAPPAPVPEPPKPSVLDQVLKPVLLDRPPEAKPAATQSAMNQKGTVSPDPPTDKPVPAGTPDAPPGPPQPATKPVEVPQALAAAESETSVPPLSHAPDTDKPAPVGPDENKPATRGDPKATAQAVIAELTSSLPMSTLPIPSTFRAALASQGTSSDGEYRGTVFGAIARAQESVDDAARDKHLKGQVVLSVVLTDTGAIDKLTIVQSSGNAASDAFAVAIVRKAAPFPAPPPGASRLFTPAVTFGES